MAAYYQANRIKVKVFASPINIVAHPNIILLCELCECFLNNI